MRMRRTAICGLHHSTTILHTISYSARLLGKTFLNTKCVFWLSPQLLSETFLILRKITPDIIINVNWSSYKVPLFLTDCNETFESSRHISGAKKKKKQSIAFHEKSVPWVASCSLRMDGKAWWTQQSLFSNFVNSPKRRSYIYIYIFWIQFK